jgi:nuclear GTP-binding protein
MGKFKKEKNRFARKVTERMTAPLKGENFYRDAKQVKRLNMIKGGRPVRNSDGKIIQDAEFQQRLKSGTQSRVQPDRKWFGMFICNMFDCDLNC